MFFRPTMGRLLVSSFVLVVGVTTLVLVMPMYHSAWESAWRQTEKQHRLLVQALRSAIGGFIRDRRAMLAMLGRRLAALPVTAGFSGSVTAELSAFRQRTDGFDALYFMDRQGRIVGMHGDRSLIDGTVAPPGGDLFARIANGRFPAMSEVRSTPTRGRNTIVWGHPVVDARQRLRGVLFAELNLDVLDALREPFHLGRSGRIVVVDEHGSVVAQADDRQGLQKLDRWLLPAVRETSAGTVAFGELVSPSEQQSMIVTRAALPETKWRLLLVQPRSEVVTAVQNLFLTGIRWALLGMLIAAAVAMTVSRWMSQPLNRLARSSVSLIGKQFQGTLAKVPDSAPLEVQEIGWVMNDLVRRLLKARDDMASFNVVLQQHTDQIRQARDQAVNADRAKSALLAVLSRELRDPLTTLIGDSERMLLAILDDLQDFCRIESDRFALDVQSADLGEMLRQVLDQLEPAARRSNRRLVVNGIDALGPLRTDVARVRRIIAALLHHSLRSGREGEVRLSAERTVTPSGDRVTIVIADTGYTVTGPNLHAFFTRLEADEAGVYEQYGGLGLALAVYRQLCRRMGGDLELVQENREGVVYTITLTAIPACEQPWPPMDSVALA